MTNRKTAIIAASSFLTVSLLLLVSRLVSDVESLSEDELKDHAATARLALDGNPKLEAETLNAIDEALTRMPVVVEDSSPVATEHSAEDWDKYPITDAHPVYSLMAGSLEAENLFRSKYLNPRDVVLSLSLQKKIREVIRLRVPPLKRMMDMAHGIMTQELEALIATGKARHVSYQFWYDTLDDETKRENEAKREKSVKSIVELLGLSEDRARKEAELMRFPNHEKMFGFKPYGVQSTGDDFYAAELKELPRTMDLRHAFILAVLDITYQLGAIYQDALALTDKEFSELVEGSEALLDQLFPDLNFR